MKSVLINQQKKRKLKLYFKTIAAAILMKEIFQTFKLRNLIPHRYVDYYVDVKSINETHEFDCFPIIIRLFQSIVHSK